jgi:hypothetical protein
MGGIHGQADGVLSLPHLRVGVLRGGSCPVLSCGVVLSGLLLDRLTDMQHGKLGHRDGLHRPHT